MRITLFSMEKPIPDSTFDFVCEPKQVLSALLDSKDHETAIGIRSPSLGEGVFVTSVDEILLGDGNDETKIILKGYDSTGCVLPTNEVRLSDIEAICRFSSKFENPFLKAIKRSLTGE